jgi:hypothetical protein
MPVTERLMAPGDWSVQLLSSTPHSVLQAVDIDTAGFGHVVITPAQIPANAYSKANLLDVGVYTGVYRQASNLRLLRGSGLATWLGDEENKGDILSTAVTKAAGTFVQWITDLVPSSLTAGTYTAIAGTLNWSAQYQSRRQAIDYVCDYFGGEWRIAGDGTVSVGTISDLYGSDPVAIFTPWFDGRESPTMIGVRGTIGKDEDLDDWTSKTYVKDAAGAYGTATIGSNPYQDLNGNAAVKERYIDGSSTVTSGTGNSVASGQLGRFDEVRRRLTISTDTFCFPALVDVGSYVWAFDPNNGVYTLSADNQVQYRGQQMWPKKVRVYDATWPIREGMGVYFIDHDDEITDLSPFVEWESGDATVGVGAPIRNLSGAMKRTGLRA